MVSALFGVNRCLLMSPGEKSRTMNIPKFWMMKYKIFFKKQMQNLKGGGIGDGEYGSVIKYPVLH